jgi:hypothetical protein
MAWKLTLGQGRNILQPAAASRFVILQTTYRCSPLCPRSTEGKMRNESGVRRNATQQKMEGL